MPVIDKSAIAEMGIMNKVKMIDLPELMMRTFSFNTFNSIYDKYAGEVFDIDFIDTVLKDLNISCDIDETALAQIPKEGPFIVLSNHPFGLLDGMLLISTICKVRPDFKVLVNFLLDKLEPVKDFFVYVDPFEEGSAQGKNLSGVKKALGILRSGSPLGIFPAGEVSTFQPDRKAVTDKAWSETIIRFAKSTGVPILPVYFHGKNSTMFHLLGLIHPMLRTVKIPSELLKKRNHTVSMRIGSLISKDEIAVFDGNIPRLSRYLRARVYGLGTGQEVTRFFQHKPNFFLKKQQAQPIASRREESLMQAEIDRIHDQRHWINYKGFDLYCAPAQEIPNILHEIGRQREINFRLAGEGTNLPLDLDEYDLHYMHLFIWDKENGSVIGAYRLGEGKRIMQLYGKKGFYISSLFKLKKGLGPILSQSLELGRSFVAQDYQKKPFPLFLLWQGISYYLYNNAEYKYIIGPVSISDNFSAVSKGLLVEFIKAQYWNKEIASLVKPKKDFKFKMKGCDWQELISQCKDLKMVEKQITGIEPQRYKVPVLLKKYIRQNARIVAFNVDPKFNNALDGLIFCEVDTLPDDMNKELFLKRGNGKEGEE